MAMKAAFAIASPRFSFARPPSPSPMRDGALELFPWLRKIHAGGDHGARGRSRSCWWWWWRRSYRRARRRQGARSDADVGRRVRLCCHNPHLHIAGEGPSSPGIELMILGFISLLLTFGQNYITKICISDRAADTMLPCKLENTEAAEGGEHHRRRLLWYQGTDVSSTHRILSEGAEGPSCPPGKVSLITIHALHQLHIFIFFLAVFHFVYSGITMALGRAKIRAWKEWESDTTSADYEYSNDPARFRFSHETSFVRQHASLWNGLPFSFYFASFFRQFLRSVRKPDYLSLRHGFVTVHLAPGSKFDFQKYIKRSLEDDFKVVVGISPILWASAVIFLLLNVNGWQTLFWISVIPLIIILAVGTKLQAIISKMAIEIKERHAVIQGIPLVQLSDHHFWFGRPHFILSLIHFTLFQNAFQIIYFLWIWYEFGLRSCFHENFNLIIVRVILGLVVQFLCSYITLPLYALVSQMGSHMKRSIFDEQTSKALMKWHQAAKKKQGASTTCAGDAQGRRGDHPGENNGTSLWNGRRKGGEPREPTAVGAIRRYARSELDLMYNCASKLTAYVCTYTRIHCMVWPFLAGCFFFS